MSLTKDLSKNCASIPGKKMQFYLLQSVQIDSGVDTVSFLGQSGRGAKLTTPQIHLVPGSRKHEALPLLPHLPSFTHVVYLSVTIFRTTRTISCLFHSALKIVIKTTLFLSCEPRFCSIFYVEETCISETLVRSLE